MSDAGPAQFGGGKLGGPALSGTTTVPQDFRALPRGAIRDLLLTFTFSGIKSSGSAFTFVVNTGASMGDEAVDDIDIVMNYAFTSLTLWWNSKQMAFSLTPAQLRTVLALFNQRDFTGSLMVLTGSNGIPVSTGTAVTKTVVMNIPVSLAKYFLDGDIFRQGARQMRDGRIDFQCGTVASLSVACANGTFTATSVAVNVYALLGAGSENDVGNTWRVERKSSIPTIYYFDDRPRIAFLDKALPGAATSTYNAGPYGLVDPTTLQGKYQNEVLAAGGSDITGRCTPIVITDRNRKFTDLAASLGRGMQIESLAGATSLTVYDIVSNPPDDQVVQEVAQQAGAGGPVLIEHPTPHSLPAGSAVPAALVHSLPVRIKPGSAPRSQSGSSHAAVSPAAAAAQVRSNRSLGAAFGQLLRATKKY